MRAVTAVFTQQRKRHRKRHPIFLCSSARSPGVLQAAAKPQSIPCGHCLGEENRDCAGGRQQVQQQDDAAALSRVGYFPASSPFPPELLLFPSFFGRDLAAQHESRGKLRARGAAEGLAFAQSAKGLLLRPEAQIRVNIWDEVAVKLPTSRRRWKKQG